MLRRWCISTIILLTAFTALGARQNVLKTGQPAPDFELLGHDNKVVKLSELKGKTVILEWWNKDCPYVRKHYDSKNMQNLQKKYTDKGAVWLTVLSSAPEKQGYLKSDEIAKVMTEQGAKPSRVLMDPDGKVGHLYSAKTTPHMYIIKPDGNLAYQGAIDSISSADAGDIPKATNYISSAMNLLSQGKTPNPDTTRPYGCGVKYK